MARRTSRGLLHTETARQVLGPEIAVDEFHELPGRKQMAGARARSLGHNLGPWHVRKNDPAGRSNAFCRRCGRVAVVAIEPPIGFDAVYGSALAASCQ